MPRDQAPTLRPEMSLIFATVNVLISYIIKEQPQGHPSAVGFHFDAGGLVYESPHLYSPGLREFLLEAASVQAAMLQDDWRAHRKLVLYQINVRFDDVPLRDHIRMDYEIWTPVRESEIPDWTRSPPPRPGPGCQVQ